VHQVGHSDAYEGLFFTCNYHFLIINIFSYISKTIMLIFFTLKINSIKYNFILRCIPTDHDTADTQNGTKCSLKLRRYPFSVPFGRAQIIARLRTLFFLSVYLVCFVSQVSLGARERVLTPACKGTCVSLHIYISLTPSLFRTLVFLRMQHN
jgi:hypothetical protein